MMYLIDTNIISEVRKGERCNANVAAWYAAIEDADIYLSVLVTGEIRKGIERVRPRDPRRAEALERWLELLQRGFAERILPIDRAIADEWGRMSAIRPAPVIDGLLAATAKVLGLTLVTRDTGGLDGFEVNVLNPFEF
ncbi:MAG: type II toxin-antitoxin system VapC family toxin [Candidatus Dadabacteria bacterium]|nr:MAG: type II toxin-antitoxin system VapC family toxin [Candidatus Dadabacteria bacterium]